MRPTLFLLVIAACDNSPAQLNITKQVGGEGGTVAAGDTSVQIPAGALGAPSTISISSIDAPAPAGAVVVGPAFDFGPDGQTFTSPVTLTLPFDAGRIPSGSTSANILVYTAARGSSDYTTLPASVSGSTVQTQTSHFTVYLPAVPIASTDLGHGFENVDLACGAPSCSPISSGQGGCQCSQSCAGSTFVMTCTGSTTASCGCTVNGSPTNSFAGDCSNLSSAESIFFSMCGAS